MSYNSESQSIPPTYPPWQACWNEQYQCYYFWNTETNETTYDHPNTRQNAYSNISHSNYSAPLTNIDDLFDKIDNMKEELDKEKPQILEKLNLSTKSSHNSGNSSTIESENLHTPETNNESAEVPEINSSGQDNEQSNTLADLSNDPTMNQTYPSEQQEFDTAYYDLYRQEGIALSTAGTSYPSSDHVIVGAFNSKSGKFQADTSVNPEMVSQASKAARMCDVFFDYQSYQDQRNAEIDQHRMHQHFNPGQVPSRKGPKLTKAQIKKLAKAKKEKKELNKKKWLLE